MTDLYLDTDTYDISFEDGDLKLVPSQQELCRQQVVIALLTFRGEWFRDTSFGVPWLENEENPIQLLGSKNKQVFDAEIRRVILREPTVVSISKFQSVQNYDGTTKIEVEAISEYGPITITTTI